MPIDSMTAVWVDPGGVEWPLTDTSPERGYFTRTDIAGWGARPYELVTDPVAAGGDQVRFVRAQSARLTWPMHVFSDTSHTDFLTKYALLRAAFMSTVWLGAPGTLRVTRPDGSAREIEAFYEDGFRGEPGEMWFSANPVLSLFCPDGYWRDTTVVTEERAYTPGADFYDPFPTVSSSQVLGRVPVVNDGEVLTWPSWHITGPATVVTATNHTTGQSWILTFTLAAGETATVNTTPRPTARGPLGQNLVGSFNWPTAYLWPLLPGTNDVEFTVAGAATGTAIEMLYQARYEGA